MIKTIDYIYYAGKHYVSMLITETTEENNLKWYAERFSDVYRQYRALPESTKNILKFEDLFYWLNDSPSRRYLFKIYNEIREKNIDIGYLLITASVESWNHETTKLTIKNTP